MGYVKRTANGCEVRFMRFRGGLCPLVFLPAFTIILLFCIFMPGTITKEDYYLRLILGIVSAVVSILVTTFIECMTERSEDGRRTLLSMVLDPTDPLANYNNV